jgi:Zn-finger nucleic acid-binding protein
MKCPKDKSLLKRNIKQQVFGDCCNVCDGVFLSGEGLKAFKTNFDTEVLETKIAQSDKLESQLFCPHCYVLMNVVFIDNIEIESCQICNGVWFDKGEALSIINKYGPQQPTDDWCVFAGYFLPFSIPYYIWAFSKNFFINETEVKGNKK